MSKAFDIVEVGLRDGLQNTKQVLSVKDRYTVVKQLSKAGLKRIELGSFVPPKLLPQMQDTDKLTKKVLQAQNKGTLPKDIIYFAFVPNEIGFNCLVDSGLKYASFFVSCTEAFSQKNINKSVKESLLDLKKIALKARRLKIKLRVYISATFYCPYEGKVSFGKVRDLALRILQEDVWELSLSDTVGGAVYSDVMSLMHVLDKQVPRAKIAFHFHNTRGLALTNVLAGVQSGVRVFDSSIGGLGGCPYAPGAGGNVATEDLHYMLNKMRFKTGLDIQKLIKTTLFLEKKLGKTLDSKLSRAKFLL